MVEKNLSLKNNKHLNFHVIIPFLSLFIVLAIFGVLIPEKFANTKNMILIIQQSIITMTVGFGMTYVIVGGGIDLSVGSVLALSGMIGTTIAVSLNPILGLFVSILVGLVCGVINGVIFSFLRIPSFIVTLGMLQMARGLTTIYSKGFPVMMPREILWMGNWPGIFIVCLLYTSPSPRDLSTSRMPSSA